MKIIKKVFSGTDLDGCTHQLNSFIQANGITRTDIISICTDYGSGWSIMLFYAKEEL